MIRKIFRKGMLAVITASIMVSVSACGSTSPDVNTGKAAEESSGNVDESTGETVAESSAATDAGTADQSADAGSGETTVSGNIPSAIEYSAVTSAMINFKSDDSYKRWSRGLVITVRGKGDTVEVSGKGGDVSCDGTDITINTAGTYVFEGTIDDGSITVDVDKSEKVRIILNGFDITNSEGPTINIVESDKVSVSLEDGTENTVTDGSTYADETLSAAIYSMADLVFNGTGKLTVNANYNDGIQSKDDLRIVNGTYIINAVDDGIVGRDRLEIKDGTFEIECDGDALKSTYEEKSHKGYIYIADGTYTINSGDEAIDAAASVLIENGEFTVTTAGGSENAVRATGEWEGFGNQGRSGGMQYGGGPHGMGPGKSNDQDSEDSSVQMTALPENRRGQLTFTADDGSDGSVSGEAPVQEALADENDDTDTVDSTASGKGFKCGGVLEITGGTFILNTQDDAIHSDDCVRISNGTFTIQAGDDGIHADDTLDISGGDITITDSYEGLEAVYINISGGNTSVTTADDGVNAAGGECDSQNASANTSGEDSSSEDRNFGGRSGQNDIDGMHGGMGGMFGESSGYLTITGGFLYVNADGDGLDANTDIIQKGGKVIVEGPTNNGNGALDYGNSYVMSGGTLTTIGSAGMLQNISDSSKSCGLTVLFSDNVAAGTTLSVENSSGKELTSITTTKVAETLQFAGDGLDEGGTYSLCADGEKLCDITLTGTITTVDDSGEEASVSGMTMSGGHVPA